MLYVYIQLGDVSDDLNICSAFIHYCKIWEQSCNLIDRQLHMIQEYSDWAVNELETEESIYGNCYITQTSNSATIY